MITSLYLSLSEGENCPKLQSFGIKLSRFAAEVRIVQTLFNKVFLERFTLLLASSHQASWLHYCVYELNLNVAAALHKLQDVHTLLILVFQCFHDILFCTSLRSSSLVENCSNNFIMYVVL